MSRRETLDPRERADEDRGVFQTAEILRRQYERPDAALDQGVDLNTAMANAEILRQNNPPASTDLG